MCSQVFLRNGPSKQQVAGWQVVDELLHGYLCFCHERSENRFLKVALVPFLPRHLQNCSSISASFYSLMRLSEMSVCVCVCVEGVCAFVCVCVCLCVEGGGQSRGSSRHGPRRRSKSEPERDEKKRETNRKQDTPLRINLAGRTLPPELRTSLGLLPIIPSLHNQPNDQQAHLDARASSLVFRRTTQPGSNMSCTACSLAGGQASRGRLPAATLRSRQRRPTHVLHTNPTFTRPQHR